MPPMKKQQNPENLGTALSVVQEGLKSMQALQKQTAEAHQKFLETQTEASRALQSMMAQTQGLIEAFLGSEAPVRDPLGHADRAQALEPQPSRPPTETVEEGNPANVSQLAVAPVIPFRKKEVSTADDTGHLPVASQAAQIASAPAASPELAQTLLAVVGRLTGYPEEMLNLEMDIEADLGIDSIKRVEILSALEEGLPGLPAVSPEVMGGLKTLGQIVDHFQSIGNGDPPSPNPAGIQAFQPAEAASAAHPQTAPASDVARALLAVVGRLTGYPEEMLNLEMDIEADLGIDSIKRVEILSALEEGLPGLPAVSPEVMGGLKTLGQIVDYLQGDANASANPEIPEEPLDPAAAPVVLQDEGTLQRQVVRFERSAFTAGPELKIPHG